MPDRTTITAACLAHLRKVEAAHPDALAKLAGVSVESVIAALDCDSRFTRVAGTGGWWWQLSGTPATSLEDLRRDLAAARSEIAALKAEVARLSAPPAPTALDQQYGARGVDYREVLASRGDAAAEQIVPGNSRPREAGGWFAAVLRRLDGPQTIGDVAAADQRNLKAASVACAMASKKGLIEQAGKRGRAVLWRLKVAA